MKGTKAIKAKPVEITTSMPMTRDCVSDIREIIIQARRSVVQPHLRNCRLFYKAYPTEAEIRYALRIKLTWTHHRAIMRVQEPKARSYYLREAEAQGWDTRELERRMFATKLLPFLPTKAELTDEIERSRTRTNLRKRPTKAQLAKCVADAERQIELARKTARNE